MKTYKGYRAGASPGAPCTIRVWDGKTGYWLPHVMRHSESFNWGYGGSGPADTALSILTDCLGAELAEQLYQAFKMDFVAGWGRNWQISEHTIKAWTREQSMIPMEKETQCELCKLWLPIGALKVAAGLQVCRRCGESYLTVTKNPLTQLT